MYKNTFLLFYLFLGSSCGSNGPSRCDITYRVICSSQLTDAELHVRYPDHMAYPWNKGEEKCVNSPYPLPVDEPQSFFCRGSANFISSSRNEDIITCNFEEIRMEYILGEDSVIETNLDNEEQMFTPCEHVVSATGSSY